MPAADLERALRDLQNQVDNSEKLHELKYQQDQKAIAVALVAADKRLDLLNESKRTVEGLTANITNRMMPREELETRFAAIAKEQIAARDAAWARVEAHVAPFVEKLDRIGRPNVGLMISMGLLGISLFSGLWFVLGLQINDRSTPLALEIETLKTQAAAREANLGTITTARNAEILALNGTISRVSEQIELLRQSDATLHAEYDTSVKELTELNQSVAAGRAARGVQDAVTQQKMVEIETQFRTYATVINLMKDDTHQMIGVLWSKVFPGIALPDKSYRPAMTRDPQAP
jgi:hypothetical protein